MGKAVWLRDKRGDKTGLISYGDGAKVPIPRTFSSTLVDLYFESNKERFEALVGAQGSSLWHMLDGLGSNLTRKLAVERVTSFLNRGK